MAEKKPTYEELEKRVKEFEENMEDYELFRQMIENSLDPVFMLDEESFQMFYVNEAAQKHYGKPLDEILGWKIPDWDPNYTHEDLPGLIERVKELRHVNIETIHKVKDNQLVPVEVSTNMIHYKGRNYIYGYINDISERKAHEQEIRKYAEELKLTNSTKDKFLSIIAHDLKNPLLAILGFMQLFQEDMKSGNFDRIKEHVEAVDNTAQKAFDLLSSLLTWSRSQSGRIKFEPKILNLQKICTEVIDGIKLSALNKNISIENAVDNIEVFADLFMLKTILRNLISNAIKFTLPEGTVTLKANKTEAGVFVSVIDTGVGMSAEQISKLFHISEQTTTAGTANESGSGLGLLLCKDFVKKHKGTIQVESNPEKGTKMTFVIPSK